MEVEILGRKLTANSSLSFDSFFSYFCMLCHVSRVAQNTHSPKTQILCMYRVQFLTRHLPFACTCANGCVIIFLMILKFFFSFSIAIANTTVYVFSSQYNIYFSFNFPWISKVFQFLFSFSFLFCLRVCYLLLLIFCSLYPYISGNEFFFSASIFCCIF